MDTITTYTVQEQELVIQSALIKKEQKAYDEEVRLQHFKLRCMSIQGYFLRLSSEHKKQLILKLVDQLKSPASLYQIFSIMSLGHAKAEMYAVVDPQTDFIFGKMILDHDRMMGKKVLNETINKDMEWFNALDEDQQINFLMGLIRIASGTVKRNLYLPLYRIYRTKLCSFSKYYPSTVKLAKSTLKTNEQQLVDEKEYDPKHPASVEVEKQRKKWLDIITKYKNEVLQDRSKISKQKNKKGAKEKKNKKDKVDKQPKEKIVDIGKIKSVDMIQLLPIWIVKKIFCYFSTKELINLKNVNTYWHVVITELLAERKCREKLNANLKKKSANINPEILEKYMQPSQEERLTVVKRKYFYELGALSKELVPKKLKKLVHTSLEANARKKRLNEFDLNTGEFVTFPRLIQKDIELYRFRPGFLHTVGLWFTVDDEIMKQKSFLSYSLSKSLSTLKINVEAEALDEW